MTSHQHEIEDHDRGLLFDMQQLAGRRHALALFGGTALAALAGCSTRARTGASASSSTASAAGGSGTDVGVIPQETADPYPADGDTPMEGAAVCLRHCNRDGQYSMYDRAVADENYLRGLQASAADGSVTCTSIFPACYSGRRPHIHFEVQIALPENACSAVYATTGYEQSVSNMTRVSLTGDNVFGDDGGISQPATMSGSVSAGYTAALMGASDRLTRAGEARAPEAARLKATAPPADHPVR